MVESANDVVARRDGLVGDSVEAVVGGVEVASEIVRAVPPEDVLSCRIRLVADEVAQAAARLVFEDERDVAGFGKLKVDRNRRMYLAIEPAHELGRQMLRGRTKRTER